MNERGRVVRYSGRAAVSGRAARENAWAAAAARFGLVVMAVTATPAFGAGEQNTASRFVHCSARAPAGSSGWSWREIEGKRCWYLGPRGLDKHKLHWQRDLLPDKVGHRPRHQRRHEDSRHVLARGNQLTSPDEREVWPKLDADLEVWPKLGR